MCTLPSQHCDQGKKEIFLDLASWNGNQTARKGWFLGPTETAMGNKYDGLALLFMTQGGGKARKVQAYCHLLVIIIRMITCKHGITNQDGRRGLGILVLQVGFLWASLGALVLLPISDFPGTS